MPEFDCEGNSFLFFFPKRQHTRRSWEKQKCKKEMQGGKDIDFFLPELRLISWQRLPAVKVSRRSSSDHVHDMDGSILLPLSSQLSRSDFFFFIFSTLYFPLALVVLVPPRKPLKYINFSLPTPPWPSGVCVWVPVEMLMIFYFLQYFDLFNWQFLGIF